MDHTCDIWREKPTLKDLEELERLGNRRTEIEAVEAAGDGPAHRRQAAARRLLLDTLDEMEEALCLYGWQAPVVVEGWQKLACFASFGRNGHRGSAPGEEEAGETPALPARAGAKTENTPSPRR